jgi:hypothetical protein
MDSTAFISGYISAQIGRVQLAAAGSLLRANEDRRFGPVIDAASIVKLVDAAEAGIEQFANAAAGIGRRVNLTA